MKYVGKPELFTSHECKGDTDGAEDNGESWLTWPSICMHDDGFFSSWEDSVNAFQVSAVNHLEEDEPGCGIDCLIWSRFVDLVVDAFLAFALLDGKVSALVGINLFSTRINYWWEVNSTTALLGSKISCCRLL